MLYAMPLLTEECIQEVLLIAKSYKNLTGRDLALDKNNTLKALWNSTRAIVAHNRRPDPIFFYGNAKALEIFEMDFATFTKLPSRLSAEPSLQSVRADLLARVSRLGVIDDYEGVRISSSGRRFLIRQATVWNIVDDEGVIRGQAAAFSKWTYL